MRREDVADLAAFAAVAETRSFTRAARQLGITQSALSQIIRRLEERLEVRLLARTTRSVAPTEHGEWLLASLQPMLRELDENLTELRSLRDKPSGTIRITSVEHAAKTVILPALSELLPDHPNLSVEIVADYSLTDVVSGGFDAGVRIGEQVAKDMIAVRISPDIEMAVVGSPGYIKRRGRPSQADDVLEHACINLRLPSAETVNPWRLLRDGQEARFQVNGSLVFNTVDLIRDAALDGHGLAYLPLDLVEGDLVRGHLVHVLKRATPPLPGYHLYYPTRRHYSPAFKLLVDTLRYRA